jgi:hypothetical protein
VTDRAEKVYDAYQNSKKDGKKFKFRDGVKTFFKDSNLSNYISPVVDNIQNIINRPPEAVKTMTKSYGGLHPRLKLKNE